MRTPGDDFELAAGFLVTEGVVAPGSIRRVAYCDDVDREDQRFNVVTVHSAGPVTLGADRAHAMTSACGICGITSLDAVEVRCDPLPGGPAVGGDALRAMPDRLREAQRVFDATGGLHAAGSSSPAGRLLVRPRGHRAAQRGRQGRRRRRARPATCRSHGRVLMVSGRAGFEIVQKAAVAGIPVAGGGVGPVEPGGRCGGAAGMTLVGFLRDDGFNVYCGPSGSRGPDGADQAPPARPVGGPAAERHRADEAEPLPGHAPGGLGEPARTALRLADPAPRACATAARSASRACTTGRSRASTSAPRA